MLVGVEYGIFGAVFMWKPKTNINNVSVSEFKNAFLIVAHKEEQLLIHLLNELDDERNIIVVHLGKEISKSSREKLCRVPHKAVLLPIKPMKVQWGASSLITVMLRLMERALSYSKASCTPLAYLHYLSGQDFPLLSQDEFHKVFSPENQMNYMNCVPLDDISRIDYYWFLRGAVGRRYNSFLGKIEYWFVRLQQRLKISRLKNCPFSIYKGNNWCSIKPDLAEYLLSSKRLIKKHFYWGNVADELVVPSIAHSSSRFSSTISYWDGRLFDWNRGNPYVFDYSDFESVVNSGCFFVRKCSFSTESQKRLVVAISQHNASTSRSAREALNES